MPRLLRLTLLGVLLTLLLAPTAVAAEVTARDSKAKVSFRLDGDELTVTLSSNAPSAVRTAMRGQRIGFFCERQPRRSGRDLAVAARTFPRFRSRTTVTLSRDLSRRATVCGVERANGKDIALGFIRRSTAS
jgi:hypothetical protein